MDKQRIAAAVREISVRAKPVDPSFKHVKRLGMRNAANYFNSGVMIMDLNLWRRERLKEKLIDISVERFDDLDASDQDALNIVLEDRVLLLDEVWNTSQYEKPAPLAGRIVHLIGTVKPWHARYSDKFRDAYYKEIIFKAFRDILDRTEFRDWRPWDPAGLGRYTEMFTQNIPTIDMLLGKLRRLAAGVLSRK